MLAHYDGALLALDEWKGMKHGLVRIGAGPTLSSYILPVLLKKYQRAHPDIDLLVESGHTPVLLDQFRQAKLDLALLVSPELHESSDIFVEAAWQFEMVLVSGRRPAHHCRLADLKSQRFVLFHKGSRMEEPIDRYFAAHGFEPRVLMRFDNAEAIKAMIHSGFGISMLPMWIVDADLRDGKLSLIQQEEPPLVSQIVLARRKSGYLTQAVRAFISEAKRLRWTRPRLSTQPPERGPKAGPGKRAAVHST
jgi:DNA-binding transcriptional LysR family regulator